MVLKTWFVQNMPQQCPFLDISSYIGEYFDKIEEFTEEI